MPTFLFSNSVQKHASSIYNVYLLLDWYSAKQLFFNGFTKAIENMEFMTGKFMPQRYGNKLRLVFECDEDNIDQGLNNNIVKNTHDKVNHTIDPIKRRKYSAGLGQW